MYGMVMLAAMVPGADPAPEATTPAACYGCTGGCNGVVVYGCAGCTGYASCYGLGCHGGLFARLHAKKALKYQAFYAACHGCYGNAACFGSYACYGCYGFGTLSGTPWACHGGCYGGYYGIGSAFGPSVIMVPTVWGHRTTGGWGYAPPAIYGYPPAVYGTVTPPAPPEKTPQPIEQPKEKKEDKPAEKKMGANLKFVLPAEAKLYVDGQLTTPSGTERVFATPPLLPGQLYYYDVKAELNVHGRTVTEEKRVIVQAGANITETFGKLLLAAEGRGESVAGK